jgi:FixJ family two-component response regulator
MIDDCDPDTSLVGFRLTIAGSKNVVCRSISDTNGVLVHYSFIATRVIELQNRLSATRISLPVIRITSHGDVRMAKDAMRAGACQFLEKLLRLHELWASIQEAIRLAETRWRDREQCEENAMQLASLTEADNDKEILDSRCQEFLVVQPD